MRKNLKKSLRMMGRLKLRNKVKLLLVKILNRQPMRRLKSNLTMKKLKKQKDKKLKKPKPRTKQSQRRRLRL